MKETDAAYVAGLFDGEGHVIYKQYPKQRKGQMKAYPTWKITLEMNMTEESIIRWVHEILGVGTVCKKPPGKGQIIDHYQGKAFDGKIVDLDSYRRAMSIE